jgi:hypothetical protein
MRYARMVSASTQKRAASAVKRRTTRQSAPPSRQVAYLHEKQTSLPKAAGYSLSSQSRHSTACDPRYPFTASPKNADRRGQRVDLARTDAARELPHLLQK